MIVIVNDIETGFELSIDYYDKYIMSNFASIFQQFKNPNTSQLADLLQQPSTTLEKLLEQDCFLSQYRTNNPQLIDYLTYDKYKQLTEFITLVGPENQRNRSYKYPFIAVDILSFASQKCLDYFLPKQPIFVNENVYQEVQVQVQENSSLCSDMSFRSSFGQSEKVNVSQADQNLKPQQKENQKILKLDKEDEQDRIQQNLLQNKGNKIQNQLYQHDKTSKIQTQQQNIQKNIQQISPDDFPDAYQPKKIVKKKEVIKKTVKRQVRPLIELLFDYFYQQVNYTLSAYVSRVLISFIEKRSQQFFKQFFTYQSHTIKKPSPIYIQILQHIESKSVSELVVKLLTYDCSFQEYFSNKQQMVWIMVNAISIDSNLDAISQTGATLVDLLIKIGNNPIAVTRGNTNTDIKVQTISQNIKETLLKIFDIDFFKKAIQITFGELQANSAVSGSVLLAYLKNITPPNKEKAQQLIQFQKLVNQIILKGLAKIADQSSNNLLETPLKYQGKNRINKFKINKLRILQCITYLFTSNTFNCCQMIPSENTGFCQQLTELYQTYPMNNLTHNQLLKIIFSILSPAQLKHQINSAIINLIDSKCLYKLLKQALQQRYKIGYFGHCIKIANKLQQINSCNFALNQLLSKDRWYKLLMNYFQINTSLNGTSLGGFHSRKGYCCQVMFQKQEILLKFDTFLKGQRSKQLNMDDFDFPQKSQSSSIGERQNQELDVFDLQITQKDRQKYLFQDQDRVKLTVSQINHVNKLAQQQLSVKQKGNKQSKNSGTEYSTKVQNSNALKQIKENSQIKSESQVTLKSVFSDKEEKAQMTDTNENTKVQ